MTFSVLICLSISSIWFYFWHPQIRGEMVVSLTLVLNLGKKFQRKLAIVKCYFAEGYFMAAGYQYVRE